MLFTVKQVAARLNISLSTVYEEIRSGRLEVFRLGLKRGVIRVDEAATEAYLQASRVGEEKRVPSVAPPGRALKHIQL